MINYDGFSPCVHTANQLCKKRIILLFFKQFFTVFIKEQFYNYYLEKQKKNDWITQLLYQQDSKLKSFAQILVLINLWFICCHLKTTQTCLQLAQSLRQKQNVQAKQLLDKLSTTMCMAKLSPAYKWSQNMSHIQVKISFHASTHPKMCDQILYQQKDVTYQNFQIRTICKYGTNQIILLDYELNIRTFKSLDFITAQWNTQQQNSIVLQCLKSPAPYFWPILHSRSITPARNPKIWWQMMARYGSQLRKVIDLLQIGDTDIQISRKVKNKKRVSIKQKQKPQYYCYSGSPQYLGSWL